MRLRLICPGALVLALAAWAHAQITASDVMFLGMSSRSRRLPYQQAGSDMSVVGKLMTEVAQSGAADRVKAYRTYTHALAVMNGARWTPESELATALDFAAHSNIVGTGDQLRAWATFLFDVPEAAVEPGVVLGDVRGRRAGETIGLTFDPSKLAGPGLHTLRATLRNRDGKPLYRYYRTSFVVKDLAARLAALEGKLAPLPESGSAASTTARYILEAARQATQSYTGGSFHDLLGYTDTVNRDRNMAQTEVMDR
jgi:hypothetical protein